MQAACQCHQQQQQQQQTKELQAAWFQFFPFTACMPQALLKIHLLTH
jgi:hypothetical protein